MRVLLLTGKGGVGKTSMALATAFAAAERGHRCAVISTDAAHSLGDALGRPVGPRPVAIAERVTAQEVSAQAELDRSWSEIHAWLQAALFESDSLVAEELLVFPGLEELVALRAVHEVEVAGEHDVCVVDCAPTGSTLRMLRLPDVLRHLMENLWQWERRTARVLRPVAERIGAGRFVAPESVFDAFERLYAEVESVRQILLDEDRTSARLVVNPARVVIDETRRSFAYLCLYGVATDAVLVNRVLPESAKQGYFARWAERERTELADIEKSFPVPQLFAPLHPSEVRGAAALAELGREVYGARDPAELFVRRRPVRLAKRNGAALLEIDMPTARADEVDVWIRGHDLFVSVRDFERRFALPGSIGGLPIAGTRWRDGVLEVRFAAPVRAAVP
jgi:arsenite-transporting ATPase